MTPKAIYKTIKHLDLILVQDDAGVAEACGLSHLELSAYAAQYPRIRKAIEVHLRMAEDARIERLIS